MAFFEKVKILIQKWFCPRHRHLASDCREGGERSELSTSLFEFYNEISWCKLNIFLQISIECLLKLIGMENLLPSKRDLLGIYGKYVINSLSIYNILQGGISYF